MDIKLALPFHRGNDRDPAQPQLGDLRQLLADSLRGRYHQAAREGRVFTGNMAAAGAVIPIFSNTAQVCGIWNPKGSGINVVPIRVAHSYVSTTQAAGGFVLGAVLDAPAQLATGAKITAFTEGVLNTTIFNALLGDLRGPKAKFTPSAATVTAPIVLRHLGLNQDAMAATSAANMAKTSENRFDGDLIVPPGNAIFFAGNIATLVTLAVSMTWLEEEE